MSMPFAAGALAGYRVLELGTTVAGPFCGRLLADLGAEVIKIEDARGDPLRSIGRTFKGKSLYAASLLRNKAIASIDLRRPEGQTLLKTVARGCDVVIENFRPGVLEGWGLGYEALAADNPGLVLVRISGYGQTGPYAQRPGYGVIGEAVSGLRYINGDPDRPPGRMATPLTDYITGLYGAFGAVTALLARAKSGRGQVVDCALSESAFSFIEPLVPTYEKLGLVAQRTGSRLADATPNNLYTTRDGDYIHICAFADGTFRRLCEAMGRPALAVDPRYCDGLARNENWQTIDAIVAGWVAGFDLVEVERVLQEGGVPATRIFSIADIFSDPHYAARGMLVDVPDDDLGTVKLAAPLPRLSATPAVLRHAGRRIGQDTRTVLRTHAGLDDARIDALAASGVVYCDDA